MAARWPTWRDIELSRPAAAPTVSRNQKSPNTSSNLRRFILEKRARSKLAHALTLGHS